MQMIDVLKRLAELDANNTNIVKESQQVDECGMMPMGGMDHHTPASINMTADSGTELTGMLRDIMQLAGLQKVEPEHLGVEPEPTSITAEPVVAVGPMAAEPMPSAGDEMRSVLDKLNPEPAGDDLGPFQHDSDEGGEEPSDDEGDNPFDSDDEEDDEDDQEETDEGQYDNSPADPTDAPAYDDEGVGPNNHENQPGAGETSNGEKRQSNLPTATFEALMKEYKSFIGEGNEEEAGKEEDDEMEEGIEDRLKDLDPKNPVNIPAYQRKAASGDSASAAKNTKESVEETADILKLAGLK